MYLIKVVGKGIIIQGTWYRPDKQDGLYKVPEELGEYMIKTFPKQFVLIEKIKERKRKTKKAEVPQENTEKNEE